MQKISSFTKNGVNYDIFQFNGDSRLGTIKNIGAYETLEHAVSQGANVVVNITSGNNGEALRRYVLEYNRNRPLEDRIKVVHIIGPNNHEMEDGLTAFAGNFEYSIPYVFNDMETRWLTPNDRVEIARKYLEGHAKENFRVTGIADVTHFIPNEYVKQAEEVLQHPVKGIQLDYLAIPVGTGRTFIAFYTALNNLRSRGLEINTKLVGLVPEGENPIYTQFVFEKLIDGRLEHVIEGYNPVSPADKLSCHGTDLLGQLLEAKKYGHLFISINGDTVKNANKTSFHLGRKYLRNMPYVLELEDSGSVGFSLLESKIAQKVPINRGDNIGIFITGRGLYASPSWVTERMKIERRKKIVKNINYNIMTFALFSGLAISGGILYNNIPNIADKLGFHEYSRQETLYREKMGIILNIASTDNSMRQAQAEVTITYRRKHPEFSNMVSLPPEVVDEIIRRYLELNKDRIRGAQDPRDVEVFNTLKLLLEKSRRE